MLFTDLGIMRPWSEFEAQVQSQLGMALTLGVCEVVLLSETPDRMALLLFPSKLVLAQVKRAKDIARRDSRSSEGFQSKVENSADKIFSQALKPVNTLVYGIQDIKGSSNDSGLMGTQPELARKAKEISFVDLMSVNMQNNGNSLLLLDKAGNQIQLPLSATSAAVREALAECLRSALPERRHGVANWDQLREVLDAEQRSRSASTSEKEESLVEGTGAGQRILVVFEVERYHNLSNTWRTAFHPFDFEASWRWVDASGNRHPYLKSTDRDWCAAQTVPPCALDSMFKPISKWTKEITPHTDEVGWRYALAYNSSTWDSKPAFMDSVRKRKWTMTYA